MSLLDRSSLTAARFQPALKTTRHDFLTTLLPITFPMPFASIRSRALHSILNLALLDWAWLTSNGGLWVLWRTFRYCLDGVCPDRLAFPSFFLSFFFSSFAFSVVLPPSPLSHPMKALTPCACMYSSISCPRGTRGRSNARPFSCSLAGRPTSTTPRLRRRRRRSPRASFHWVEKRRKRKSNAF